MERHIELSDVAELTGISIFADSLLQDCTVSSSMACRLGVNGALKVAFRSPT